MSCLIIDPNDVTANCLETRLASAGYQVLASIDPIGSFAEFHALFRQADRILVHNRLAPDQGWEIFHQIKGIDAHKPVLLYVAADPELSGVIEAVDQALQEMAAGKGDRWPGQISLAAGRKKSLSAGPGVRLRKNGKRRVPGTKPGQLRIQTTTASA